MEKLLNIKTYTIILMILSLSIVFLSCSNDSNNNINNEYEIAFIDSLGREIRLEEKPKRVAALLGSLGDIWCLSGGSLCACSIDGWEDFNLDLENAINIGGAHSPNLELLISSNPDFVIASSSTASNVEIKDSLEHMGITVAYFDIDNFNDYLNMLDICTSITGRKDLYEINGISLLSKINEIKNKYQEEHISISNKKILLLRVSSTTFKAKGSEGTILGEMLKDIGCINIADNNKNILENLNTESIIKEDPYHIFIVTMGSNSQKPEESIKKMLKENPAWNTLNAIINNRIHFMDKRLFNLKPNVRWAESYQILYEKLTKQ